MEKMLESFCNVPQDFQCPISLEIMSQPVTLPTGITYDRQNIQRWLKTGHHSCPVTGKPLEETADLLPNLLLQRLIHEWCYTQLLESSRTFLLSPSQRGGGIWLTKEVSTALAVLPPSKTAVLAVLPDGAIEEALQLGDDDDKSAALNLLLEIVEATRLESVLAKSKLLVQALIDLLRPVSRDAVLVPAVTLLSQLCEGSGAVREKAIEAGAVPAVLNLIHSSHGALAESLLRLFSLLVVTPKGKQSAEKHVAAVHIVVQKILSESHAATELAVECLWAMCKPGEGGGEVAGDNGGQDSRHVCREAVRRGALPKALLLLQVPGVGKTKQRAIEILKVLGVYYNGAHKKSAILAQHPIQQVPLNKHHLQTPPCPPLIN